MNFVTTKNGRTYEFTARLYENDCGTWVVDTQYGYSHHTTQHREGWDSVLRGQKYEIHHQVMPKKGDRITHIKSGREFVLGSPVQDFLIHDFPLLENGKQVAILRAEDYYKD